MNKPPAYRLKNGILFINGKAVFGIGNHYYPSYHPKKVPVPKDGDRIGEMKKDFADMKSARINVIRTSAVGKIVKNGDKVLGEFPLGQKIAEETNSLGMALMVRLNGYDNGINVYPDEKMLNENDEPLEEKWSQFITNSVCHNSAREDNVSVTEAGAEFFSKFDNVVGYQIFNEPAFPCYGFYDYNPHSIEEYKKAMREKFGQADAEPPRRRPYYNESPEPWIEWRLFNSKKFNGYLNELALSAKKIYPKAETFTCMTCCPVQIGSSLRGADYFRIAEKMDIVGITLYIKCKGTFYYEHSRIMDYAESSASVFGKHLWLIEYNAKADMTAREFEVQTYAGIGSGAKGIMYYQWRGDYVFDDSPEPDGYGIVYNDRKPTKKYESAIKMHEMLYRLSDKIVCKERARQKIGILHSEHANAYFDAVCNGDIKSAWNGKEDNAFSIMSIYRKFKRDFVSLVAVRSQDLARLPYSLDALIVPEEYGFSEREKREIDEYEKKGGKAFYYDKYLDAFKTSEFKDGDPQFEAYEIIEKYGKKIASVTDRKVDLKFLEDENEYAICIVDFSEDDRIIRNLEIALYFETSQPNCVLVSGECETVLPVSRVGEKYKVIIPELINGGILFVKKR